MSVNLCQDQQFQFKNSTNTNHFDLGSESLSIFAENALLGDTTLTPEGITNTITGQTAPFKNISLLPLLQTALFAVNQPPDDFSLSVNSKLYLTNTNPPTAPTKSITIDASNLLIEYESDTNQDLILQSSSSGSLRYKQTGDGATPLELTLNPESITIQDPTALGSTDSTTITNSQILINNPNSFGDPTYIRINKDSIVFSNTDGDFNTLTALDWSGSANSATYANNISLNPFTTSSQNYAMPFYNATTGYQHPFYDNINPFTYNPSTQTLSCVRFQGSLVGTVDTAQNIKTTGISSGSNYYIPFVAQTTSSLSQPLYTDSGGHITYNPTTNQLSTDGKITCGNGLTMNGSASQLLISNNSASVPAISAPNALLVSFPSANITATTFTGALSGVASQATAITITDITGSGGIYYPILVDTSGTNKSGKINTNISYSSGALSLSCPFFVGALTGNASSAKTATNATNASQVAVISDNTSGTYYIPFVKTSGSGSNRPLYIDDATGPLSYNPSTSTLSASAYTITGTPSTASVASTFGQVGLVYLSTTQIAITGSASVQNLSFSNLFNSTYQNYKVILLPTTQVSFSQYPSYALQGFLGTGVPTIASLYGFEITSSSTSVVAPVYTAGATLSSSPLIFAVSSTTNKQVVIDIQNVGFANTAGNQVSLMCKSVYGNPGASGASDRTITCSSVSGATITGLSIQQSIIGSGNNMTLQAIVYGYNTI